MMRYFFLLLLVTRFSDFVNAQVDTVVKATTLPELADDSIYNVVDEPPQYPGGFEEMFSFMKKNMVYPPIGKQIGIQGKVHICFIIEPDGSISNPVALKTAPGGLTGEAMRIVKLMPRWKPGILAGKAVRTRCTLPVNFVLNSTGPLQEGPYEEICITYGRIQMIQKNYTDAIIGFDEAIKINPQKDEAYYLRAKAYYELKQDEEACKDLEMIKSPEKWSDIPSMKGKVCK